MAASFITSGSAQADVDPGPVTTSGLNTTGADLIVLWLAFDTTFTTSHSVSDSKSNTWTSLTLRDGAPAAVIGYYCINPTVGTGHTFSGVGRRPCIMAEAFSSGGSVSFNAENGQTAFVATSLSTNSVAFLAGDIVSAGFNEGQTPRTITGVAGAITSLDQNVTGAVYSSANGYIIAPADNTAGATFTLNAQDLYLAAGIAAFSVTGGGGGSTPSRMPLLGAG